MSSEEEPFRHAMREEMHVREQERLGRIYGCPTCGQSATGAEWDLLKFARAMNYALGQVRFIVEAERGDATVLSTRILSALDTPYRFPLPDAPEAGAG